MFNNKEMRFIKNSIKADPILIALNLTEYAAKLIPVYINEYIATHGFLIPEDPERCSRRILKAVRETYSEYYANMVIWSSEDALRAAQEAKLVDMKGKWIVDPKVNNDIVSILGEYLDSIKFSDDLSFDTAVDLTET